MNLESLHQIAVESPRFKLSKTRVSVMKNLWTISACLCRWQIDCDLWIDGSFLTEKIDPRDVDFVVVLPVGFLDNASDEQLAVLEWLCEDKNAHAKRLFQCDSYSIYMTAPTNLGHSDYLANDAYWKNQFGVSRQNEPKGMVLITVPGGCT